MIYAVPAFLKQKRREDGQEFFCPNGHGGVFAVSEVQRLTRELETERRRTAEAVERESRERRARLKAEQDFKRHRRRITNGVCPCCNRSFVNLARHMKTKHPAAVIPAAKPV